MSRSCELRVLSGDHAGASAAVHGEILVGSDLDCDIILSDEGLPAAAAAIRLLDDGWMLEDGVFSFNEPVAFGAIWLTVALPEQPWPRFLSPVDQEADTATAGREPVINTLTEAAEAMPGQETQLAEPGFMADTLLEATSPEVAGIKSARQDTGFLAQRSIFRHFGYAFVLIAAIMGVSVVIVWQIGAGRGGRAPAGSVRVSEESSIEAIRVILEELGVAGRLRIVARGEGGLALQGWVSGPEKEVIARALTRVWPMPMLELKVGDDVVAELRSLLAAFPGYHEVTTQDEQIHLAGIVIDSAEQSKILELVEGRYPGTPVLTDRLLPLDLLLDRFGRALRDAGVPEAVSMKWVSRHLEVDVRNLNVLEQNAVQNCTALFNPEYWNRVKLVSPTLQAPILPFVIRSVVSGPHPYIVLNSGTKILQGGRHQGFHLVAVEPDRVILEHDREFIVKR